MLVVLLVIIALLVWYALKLRQEIAGHARQIKQSEDRFKALFEGNQCVELVINQDTGDIIEANQAAVVYYGYSRDQLLSMKITDINMLSQDKLHKKLELTKDKKIEKPYHFKHKLADGTIRRVEVYADVLDWDGINVVYAVVIDVTERWEANKLAYKFQQAVEHAGQAITITNRKGVVEYINPEYLALTGFSR